MFRAGIHTLLGRIDLVESVCSFSSVKEACALLPRPRPAGALAVIGGAAVQELSDPDCRTDFGIPAIVLLANTDPATLSTAAQLVGVGYLLEESLTSEGLRSALERLAANETPMPTAMARHLLGRAGSLSPASLLTPRQQAVLQMMASGATNFAIARELGLSVHAVKRDVAALLTAMGCSNRTEATVQGLRFGLISRPPSSQAPVP